MERVTGSGRQKSSLLTNQLIGPQEYLTKTDGNWSLYKTFFHSSYQTIYYSCFIYIVSFGFEHTSYY
jgi:hypothetical protein